MKQRLFNIVTLLSLLLFTVDVGQWIRSYMLVGSITDNQLSSYWELGAERGIIAYSDEKMSDGAYYSFYKDHPEESGLQQDDYWPADYSIPPAPGVSAFPENGHDFDWKIGDFEMVYHTSHGTVDHHVELPFWFIAASSLVMPGIWEFKAIRRRRMRKQRTSGLCPDCGYDLRAHHSGEKCPECSTFIPALGETKA